MNAEHPQVFLELAMMANSSWQPVAKFTVRQRRWHSGVDLRHRGHVAEKIHPQQDVRMRHAAHLVMEGDVVEACIGARPPSTEGLKFDFDSLERIGCARVGASHARERL